MAKLVQCIAGMLVAITTSMPVPAAAQNDDVAALNAKVIELFDAGKISEAIPLAQRALAIGEKTLLPDNPDAVHSLGNLAFLYQSQGRYADAEPLYRRSLAIFEKALGPDHPNVAINLNNLAEVYRSQGRYADAEPLYKRALAIREKALKPDDPFVAQSLNNLATLYQNQGATPTRNRSTSDRWRYGRRRAVRTTQMWRSLWPIWLKTTGA